MYGTRRFAGLGDMDQLTIFNMCAVVNGCCPCYLESPLLPLLPLLGVSMDEARRDCTHRIVHDPRVS